MTNHVKIQDAFWEPRLQINSHQALLHQWRQLEKTGCIENFRLAAGEAEGIRMGYFYADSDAYKWLEAAARSYAGYPSAEIKGLMDAFIVLIQHAQMEDGYIYTYNQLNFPGQRWVNLQIEHELYCMGHLIEAGVSHYESTGEDTLLNTVTKTADLLVKVFSDRGPEDTPGHEEVEIALIRLYNITSDERYLNLAESFLERRGRIKPFLPYIYAQKRRFDQRANLVKEQYAAYLAQHPEHAEKFQLPPENVSINPPSIKARYDLETATGEIQKDYGIEGVGTITPTQLQIANDVFRVENLDYAKMIVERFESEGVFTIDGLYVDEPIYKNYKLIYENSL